MSIGPIHLTGNLAASQLPQARGTDTDRQSAESVRQLASAQAAGAAEIDASVQENESASDRDADGRDFGAGAGHPEARDDGPDDGEPGDAPRSRDASGQCGRNLDLSG